MFYIHSEDYINIRHTMLLEVQQRLTPIIHEVAVLSLERAGSSGLTAAI